MPVSVVGGLSFQEFRDAIQTADDEIGFARIARRITERFGFRWFAYPGLSDDTRTLISSYPKCWTVSAPNAAEPSTMPFAQRLTCTIDDACEVTGLGRTKLYELIGAGRIVTTTIGRRRLVVVRSLLALLDANMSN